MSGTALIPVIPDRTGTVVTPNTGSTGTVAGPATWAGETPSGTWVTFANSPAATLRVVWTAADVLTLAFPGGGPDGTTPTKTITLAGSSGDVLIGGFPSINYGTTVTAGSGLATTKVSLIQPNPVN